MPKVRLTPSFVATATCPPGRSKVDFYDETVTGWILEVRSNGSSTYALRYRDQYGKQRQLKLGGTSDLTFDQARKKAIKERARVVVGDNPAEERQITRRIPVFAELSKRYVEYVEQQKRSHDIDERYLRNHIVPRFGKLHLNEIDQPMVLDWLASNVRSGYAQSTVNRWQVIINLMFKLGKKWDIPGCDRNPLEGVKLPQVNNLVERYLTAEETVRLKKAVENSANPQLKNIIGLLLLTGCRKRELLDATWDQFDLNRRNWRIPMTKTGKARHVPLSDAAVTLLRDLPRWKDCRYVVPNPDTLKPYISIFNSWNSARKEAGVPDCRLHDLRHSAASNMVNSGQSLYVVAKVLGHAQTSTTQRYAHLANDTLLKAVNAAADNMGTDWNASSAA